MANHSSPQNATRRRIPSSGGVNIACDHRHSPPSLPLLSTSNSSTLSLKPVSLSGKHGPPVSSGTRGDTTTGTSQNHHPQLKAEQNNHHRALSKNALTENDAMVYLDGPQVYTCGNCRTHLTSHDDIISKSFHGRHGRAYLFDQCVNITTGIAEDRILITGLHSVSDIFCKRCQTLVGWTYAKAYESSQKYKEGKFIIEKNNLHLEESDYYNVDRPAGERGDKWRVRSMSWGSEGTS